MQHLPLNLTDAIYAQNYSVLINANKLLINGNNMTTLASLV